MLYGSQIKQLMRLRINYITKLEFMLAFGQAFKAFTEQNIKARFRATGLVPYNPERVISCLDLRLRTPTPPPSQDTNWISKTPQNLDELKRQTKHIQSRITQHQNSSLTSILEAFH